MPVKSKSGRILELPSEAEARKIEEGVNADNDSFSLNEFKQMRPLGRPKAEVTKERISIRLSPEVMQYFRATGKGWQTRMDEVLRKYVESHQG